MQECYTEYNKNRRSYASKTQRRTVMKLFNKTWKLAIAGAIVGVLAALLAFFGNPANMAICVACFIRDTAGALSLHSAASVQYFRPEIVGFVVGAFIISLITKEYKATAGSAPMIRFLLGMIMMIGALVFLGCPLRMVIRMSAGDLNAYVALIGFAGPRVIEQTIRQKLPKGFQRAEFLVEHGFVDDIVRREELKEKLGKILEMHAVSWKTENRIRTDAAELHHADHPGSDSENLTNDKCDSDRGDSNPAGINPYLTAWDRVQISRKIDRPSGSDYIEALFTDFMEFHGDRNYGDDKAIIGGIAKFHGKPVTVIVQEKGTNTKENIAHNFGMPMPEGYRKALRLMKQAEKFQRPVICFVDTPGAFCGIEAEERGQGEAIARNLWELAGLKTPVLSIVTGEGGSGGALALAAGDQVWMLENSIYSILSPEGFASILWKDSTKAKEAAAVMKLTASDLYEKGIIEQVIPEPENLTPESMWQVAERLNDKICTFLQKYTSLSEEELLETRYARFRKF